MTPQVLTPAQRRALLWLPADGGWHAGFNRGDPSCATLNALMRLGCCQKKGNWSTYSLTLGGIALRAQIEKEAKE